MNSNLLLARIEDGSEIEHDRVTSTKPVQIK